GLGMDDLWDGINEFVEEKSHAVESENEADEEDEEDARVKICFIGKPNVGKSSLSNAVLRTDRMIVSSIPGTTRDTIRQDFEVEKTNGKTWKFTLLDTAGYRNPSRITTSVDYFSSVRSNEAMEEADVVFLVVDAK